MQDFSYFAKIIIIIGAVLIVLGLIFLLLGKFTPLGRLPGDIIIKRENLTIYFPLVSLIILSIILTIIANIFLRK